MNQVIYPETNPRGVGCNLGGFTELSALEQRLILFDIQVVCSGQVGTARQFEGQFCVVERGEDVGDDCLLVDVDTEHLAFLVNTNDTVGGIMLSSDEDGFARDTVHVDTGTGLEVVEVNESVFSDEVDDTMLLGDLHSDWEIICRFRGEIDIDGLLDEWWVWVGVVDFNNVELRRELEHDEKDGGCAYFSAGGRPDCEGEQLRRLLVTIKLHFSKRSCMSLNSLADSTLPAVKLHRTLDLERRGVCRVPGDTDKDQPLLVGGDAVVDYLATGEGGMSVKYLLWGRGLVVDGPVKHGRVGDHSDCGIVHPLPENNILVVDMRFDLLLGLNVEDLESTTG